MQRPAVCEFLHGPMTSPHAVAALRDALTAGVEKHFEILYYRKDGELFIYIKGMKYLSDSYLTDIFFDLPNSTKNEISS